MKYLVMEARPAYAVVLDEAGRMMKVANVGYSVGETVTSVVARSSRRSKVLSSRTMALVGSLAACMLLVFSWYFSGSTFEAYASIYLTVNPQVKIDVDVDGKVGDLEALNGDGAKLIFDYRYKNKSMTAVMDELLDKAMELGMLTDGSTVTVDIDAEDEQWFIDSGIVIRDNLTLYLAEKVSATVVVKSYKEEQVADEAAQPSQHVLQPAESLPPEVTAPLLPDKRPSDDDDRSSSSSSSSDDDDRSSSSSSDDDDDDRSSSSSSSDDDDDDRSSSSSSSSSDDDDDDDRSSSGDDDVDDNDDDN